MSAHLLRKVKVIRVAGATDALISEATIEAAKRRLDQRGRRNLERELAATEPHLKYTISRIAVDALADMEGVPEEIQTAVYDAVWCAALLTMEAYRIAHYRLWAKSILGTVLECLDAD